MLLDGNNIADAHGWVPVVGRMFVVEAVKELFRRISFQIAGLQRGGINQIVVLPLYRPPDGFNPVQPLIADVTQFIRVLYLIDGEAIAVMGEERLLPFFLLVHAVLHQFSELRAVLPFLAGHSENTVMRVQIGSIKSHFRRFAFLHDVNCQFTLHQLIGSFFGKRKKVAVQITAFF